MKKHVLLVLLFNTMCVTSYAMKSDTEIEMQYFKNGQFQPLQKPILKKCSCRSITEHQQKKQKRHERVVKVLEWLSDTLLHVALAMH